MSATGPLAWRPLAALTAMVVAAHLWLLQEAPTALNLGEKAPARAPTINTRTLTPVAPAPTPEAAPAAPRPAPPPAPKPARPSPAAETSPPHHAAEPVPALSGGEMATLATESSANGTPTSAVTATPPGPVPASAAAAPASAPVPTPENGVTLSATVPPPVRLLYNVTGQARHMDYSARAEVLWRHDGHRYEARLEISAFLIGSRTQTSEGDITPQGLAPRRYADKWRSEQAAHFNRERQRVSFSANTPEAPLLSGAQDRLSLFVQLGALLAADPKRLPAGTSLTLQTVGPREAEPWLIKAEGEERLNLPGGDFNTLKFTRAPRREFDTRLDLWLAPSMHYLPVRIRLTQANGDFVDQQLRSTEPLDGLK